MTELSTLLACPRCDKTPLDQSGDTYHCKACDVDFPLVGEIPWMFAEPQAALGEWRGRLQFALQTLSHEVAGLEQELKNKDLSPLARRRVERYMKCVESHRRKLQKLCRPVDMQSLQGNYESYLALRTRLPTDQGLNTYYANIHRDWAWGDEENRASLKQIQSVLHDHAELGNVLVLGAGAGRLAYDIHTNLQCTSTVAMDFNPLLMLVAQAVTQGRSSTSTNSRLRRSRWKMMRYCANSQRRKPSMRISTSCLAMRYDRRFRRQTFDTVVTPWLIDVITEDLPILAARINRLLKKEGRWVNFGSLAFSSPKKSRCYSPEEVKAIVGENGFSDPYVSQATIPYMCSPASRHGRQERVFTFSAYKERNAKKPDRYKALPDWIVTGKEPVPQTPSFKQQAMTTQIYSFIMSLIDGKRSIKDMAVVLESQRLMTKEEAEPAIRSFLTKMYDDSKSQSGF